MLFKYEIFFDDTLLTCSNGVSDLFETREEAQEYAESRAKDYIEYWKEEEAWNGETINDFEIYISSCNVEEYFDDDELLLEDEE